MVSANKTLLKKRSPRIISKIISSYRHPGGEPRLELSVHVFGIMWNYFAI